MAGLHRQVAAMQEEISEQRRKMGGVNAAQECDEQVGHPHPSSVPGPHKLWTLSAMRCRQGRRCACWRTPVEAMASTASTHDL